MYKINKSTREVKVDCKYCHEQVIFTLPEDVLERKYFPLPFRYVHGEPFHSVTVYLDKQMNIRSTEFGDSLSISCEILKNCEEQEELNSPDFKEQTLKTWITAFTTTIQVFTENREEILTRVGRILGNKYVNIFKGEDITGIIEEFQNFWKINDFGFVKNIVKSDKQITFDVVDNLEVFYLPTMHKKLCFLTKAFLNLILERKLGIVFSIMELQCTANGDNICRFLIKWD